MLSSFLIFPRYETEVLAQDIFIIEEGACSTLNLIQPLQKTSYFPGKYVTLSFFMGVFLVRGGPRAATGVAPDFSEKFRRAVTLSFRWCIEYKNLHMTLIPSIFCPYTGARSLRPERDN